MIPRLKAAAIVSLGVLAPSQTNAYAIDCAILLCLSGGWPSSAECTAARAEFIRRITPWPIEPPLQIWRCPMSAELQDAYDPSATRFTQLIDQLRGSPGSAGVRAPSDPESSRAFAAALARSIQSGAFTSAQLTLAKTGDYRVLNGTADIDISSPHFDFVRSIRVFDIDWREYDRENSDGDHQCMQGRQRVRVGSYGIQGDFAWNRVDVTDATSQTWLGFTTRPHESCAHQGLFRGVGVEWRDYQGSHDYEIVRY